MHSSNINGKINFILEEKVLSALDKRSTNLGWSSEYIFISRIKFSKIRELCINEIMVL